MNMQTQIGIRARKLGVLIRDARNRMQKSIPEVSRETGFSPVMLRAYEEGRKSPSLPELEILAYYFRLPIQHFWRDQAISDDPELIEPAGMVKLVQIRQKIIGIKLRQLRMKKGISLTKMSELTGIAVGRLGDYEEGAGAVPVPELEAILTQLDERVEAVIDQVSPIGKWMNEQELMGGFAKLPPELQGFVVQANNQPYLELAMRLSQLSSQRLRQVAETLLEITL